VANKIFVTQRTNRQVVKRLASDLVPATYDLHFGEWGVSHIDNAGLNFPWGIAIDASNNVYVCDTNNRRIVKLDSSLVYVDSYSTIGTVDVPYAITFDSVSGHLYVAGVRAQAFTRIERLTTALVSVKVSGDLNNVGDLWFRPVAIVPSFVAGDWIVCGAALDLQVTTEGVSFSPFVTQTVTGETTTWPNLYATTHYFGMIKHSNGDLYLNNGRTILRVNSLFDNIGDADIISKTVVGLKEGLSSTMLTYDADNEKIVRYDEDLNYVEDVYVDTGSTVALDAYDIMDFVEVSI